MSFIVARLHCSPTLFLLSNPSRNLVEVTFNPVRYYAARKGTRERKAKKVVKKVVEEKAAFIPHNQRKKDRLLAERRSLKFGDHWKGGPIDDVYAMKYYKWIVYPFREAVESHRETHHPTMYNEPNANLHVRIELNMQGEKKTRFVDDFNRIVAIPHKFEHGEERSILAFSKSVEAQKDALDAGAQLTGGVDLIKQIQNGAVSLKNFQFFIAHPDILPELVTLRGLMKRKFPNERNGTLDVNFKEMTLRFIDGVNYKGKKDEIEKDFGLVETIIGTLNMEPQHLEENFAALVADLYTLKPKREGSFISRCVLWSPPSTEKFKVDHDLYIIHEKQKKVEEDESDQDEPKGERIAL